MRLMNCGAARSRAGVMLASVATVLNTCGSVGGQLLLTVEAGRDGSPPIPRSWTPEPPLEGNEAWVLEGEHGEVSPAQLDGQGRLWWWARPMPAGRIVRYRVRPRAAATGVDRGVELKKTEEGRVDVLRAGALFTSFNYKDNLPKPFLHPLIGPTGTGMTRDYPMKDVQQERERQRQDHEHHRSLWTAWGDVRTKDFDKPGVDYWTEGEGCGRQRVTRIVRSVSGPVFGELQAQIEWLTPAGQRQLTEYRTFRFFRGDDDYRVIDGTVLFTFTDSDVMFADTSEAGILALRVATALDEIGGGTMRNSNGRTSEKECWGQPAAWCDYVGHIADQVVGIAVMDAPANLDHPPRWHIRGYGLFAVNPIALRDFTKAAQTRSKLWKKGETAQFNYRIVVHRGDTTTAHIADYYRASFAPQ